MGSSFQHFSKSHFLYSTEEEKKTEEKTRFLPFISSSAGEMYLQSYFNVEINLSSVRLSILSILYGHDKHYPVAMKGASWIVWCCSWTLAAKIFLHASTFVLLPPSFVKSSLKFSMSVPEETIHTDSIIMLYRWSCESFAIAFFHQTFASPSLWIM